MRSLAAVLALLCLAACSSSGRVTPRPSTATLATQAVSPATYLAIVRPLLPDETDEQLIATAHRVCTAFRANTRYDDAKGALGGLGLNPAEIASVIHASVIVYCPDQVLAETSATASATHS